MAIDNNVCGAKTSSDHKSENRKGLTRLVCKYQGHIEIEENTNFYNKRDPESEKKICKASACGEAHMMPPASEERT